MKEPSYYSIMTARVRYDPRLKNFADAKVLFSEITALSNKNGYCTASNNYFAGLYDRPKETISRWINLLKKLGYLKVEIVYREGTKQVKRRKLYPISDPPSIHEDTPIHKDEVTPIPTNVKDNITSINTTSKNNTTTTSSTCEKSKPTPFDLIRQYHINANQGDHLAKFLKAEDELGDDLLCWAIEQTAGAEHPSWSYLQAVIKRLEDQGIKTVDEAEKRTEEHKQAFKQHHSYYRRPPRQEKKPQWMLDEQSGGKAKKTTDKQIADVKALIASLHEDEDEEGN